jgi:hypothetical protein
MYEDDIDIPVAIATPEFLTDQQQQQQFSGAAAAVLAPPLPLPPPPRYDMSKGRSSRVLMPDESSSPSTLSPSTIQSLQAQGFTMGLIHAMHRNTQIFPMRIWVVDNSGKYVGSRIAFCVLRTTMIEQTYAALYPILTIPFSITSHVIHRKYEPRRWSSDCRESKCQKSQARQMQSVE